jgi:hypothetical protein
MVGSWIRLERERVRKAVACITASITDAVDIPRRSCSHRVYQGDRYDEDAPLTRRRKTMDSQLNSDILLAVIGLIALVGFIGTVFSFWSMSRSGYRKD